MESLRHVEKRCQTERQKVPCSLVFYRKPLAPWDNDRKGWRPMTQKNVLSEAIEAAGPNPELDGQIRKLLANRQILHTL